MKKVLLITLCIIAGLFSACKKDNDLVTLITPVVTNVPPTLKTNPVFPNTVMVGQKDDTVIASIILNANDAAAFANTGATSISFVSAGAFKPSTGYQNMYYTIKGPSNFLPVMSDKKTTVVDGENPFIPWNRGFVQNTAYLLEVHAKVTDAATDGVGPDDQCTVIFKMMYQSDGSAQNKTLIDTAQTITFSRTLTSVIETNVDPVISAPQTITGNQEVSLLTMKVKSIGGVSALTNQTIVVSDPTVAAVVSSVKVYDSSAAGMVPIGSATLSGQTAVVPFTISIPENVEKTFVIKGVVGNVTVNASGSTFSATSDKITYKDAGGLSKVNDIDRVGGMFTLLKATQIITSVLLPGTLQNGILGDGCKIRVTSVGG
jgi:hypothetical protein